MRTLEQLMKLTEDSTLTPEEKALKYGVNPPRTTMYAVADIDGRRKVVSRVFEKGEAIPKGWEDSPAKFGIETEPKKQTDDPTVLPVVADLGPTPGGKDKPKE